jgi:hypothetical protein
MAGLPPITWGVYAAPGPNTTVFDLFQGRRKKGVDVNAEQYVLGCLGVETMFNANSITASQVATTIQAVFVLPGRCKIPKLAFYCSAIGALTGYSFNVVLGTGAYTSAASSAPGNDNGGVPDVSYGGNGVPTGTSPVYPIGGGGLASNPAVAGNTLFGADVALTVANFPNLAIATGVGPTYAQILVPASPDAVWPNGSILTLRCTTPAGGSITGFTLVAYIEPQPLSPSYPNPQTPGFPAPSLDF